jgi:hypothetical protein
VFPQMRLAANRRAVAVKCPHIHVFQCVENDVNVICAGGSNGKTEPLLTVLCRRARKFAANKFAAGY